MKNCPFCAEEIQDAAIKCKHCGEMLTTAKDLESAAHGTRAKVAIIEDNQSEPAKSIVVASVGQSQRGSRKRSDLEVPLILGTVGILVFFGGLMGSQSLMAVGAVLILLGLGGYSRWKRQPKVESGPVSQSPSNPPTGAMKALGLILLCLGGLAFCWGLLGVFILRGPIDPAQDWVSRGFWSIFFGSIFWSAHPRDGQQGAVAKGSTNYGCAGLAGLWLVYFCVAVVPRGCNPSGTLPKTTTIAPGPGQGSNASSGTQGMIDASGHIVEGVKLYTVTGSYFGEVFKADNKSADGEDYIIVKFEHEYGNLNRAAVDQGNMWFVRPDDPALKRTRQ